ncbi:MerR family transcriptional regulator [Patulibacter americanus]|uniref:MerR family transcriptional regulator n=1 Tax=Patulibacter americanus TaxID=588672 RepID=UPI0006872973|nr:MerR family transcriptional regulator [Patulibacter americanus]
MMTVGEFARFTRLSAKQLRSYDALGLLAPAATDERTGYRRYHPAQARTAVTIGLLRSLDVPLATIRDLLVAGDDDAERLLEAERSRMRRELAAGERALSALRRIRADRDLMPHAVDQAHAEPCALLALRATSTAERLHTDAAALVARLTDAVPWAAAPDAAIVGLYPLDLDGPIGFAVGAERPPGAPPPAAGDAPDLERVLLPAGPVARVLHRGPHEELPLAYFPLLAWVRERGHAVAGPVRERYVDDPAVVPGPSLRTELTIPLPHPGDPTP